MPQIGQKRKEVAEKRDRMDARELTTILFRCCGPACWLAGAGYENTCLAKAPGPMQGRPHRVVPRCVACRLALGGHLIW